MSKMIRMSKTSVSRFKSEHKFHSMSGACQKEEISGVGQKRICYWWHVAIFLTSSLKHIDTKTVCRVDQVLYAQ